MASFEVASVHKFGGVALADAAAFRHAAAVASQYVATGPLLVVASAARGVTDALIELARRAAAGEGETAHSAIAQLRHRHLTIAGDLQLEPSAQTELVALVDEAFDDLARLTNGLLALRELTPSVLDLIAARGERLSGRLLVGALRAAAVDAVYVEPNDVVMTDARHQNAFPDPDRTAAAAERALASLFGQRRVPVIPGFVGQAPNGAVTTLGRGGSDLTATLLARVLGARTVVLWKDVPGLLTADPRVVSNARLIPTLHAREASELAYYGAKVLHPRALTGMDETMRLFIRPLADPEAMGTEISFAKVAAPTSGARGPRASRPVKALSAISDQSLVMIVGNGMAGIPGIAARAFAALGGAGVSISLISQASSEHSICIGIPASSAAAAHEALHAAFGLELTRGEIDSIDVRGPVATVAVVGLGMAGAPGVAARLFGAVGDAGVNVIAIAQGASELNISLVVDEADAAAAQRAIHAAFRLDKIGGGTAETTAHIDVVLLGFGQVGREVAAQLGATAIGRDGEPSSGEARDVARRVRVVALIDRSGYLFDPQGISPRRLASSAKAKRSGAVVADLPGGIRADAATALSAISRHALSRPVLVDVTADDTEAVLDAAVTHGMDLVLANKRPLAGLQGSEPGLVRSAARRGRRVLHEATVGAGLPVIDTLSKLVESGDQVLRIEGCPSGTLGYLFGELGRGARFSDAVRQAMALGYTEPDPREDLSGVDAARKGLILGRLLGFAGELADVKVQSLVPAGMRGVALDRFLARLPELDARWARRVADASTEGLVLRYRVTVTRRSVRVGVVAVDTVSSLAALSGTDNQFAFTTRRYRTNPLVITGSGAGPAVTAAGVLNDVLKLAVAR